MYLSLQAFPIKLIKIFTVYRVWNFIIIVVIIISFQWIKNIRIYIFFADIHWLINWKLSTYIFNYKRRMKISREIYTPFYFSMFLDVVRTHSSSFWTRSEDLWSGFFQMKFRSVIFVLQRSQYWKNRIENGTCFQDRIKSVDFFQCCTQPELRGSLHSKSKRNTAWAFHSTIILWSSRRILALHSWIFVFLITIDSFFHHLSVSRVHRKCVFAKGKMKRAVSCGNAKVFSQSQVEAEKEQQFLSQIGSSWKKFLFFTDMSSKE